MLVVPNYFDDTEGCVARNLVPHSLSPPDPSVATTYPIAHPSGVTLCHHTAAVVLSKYSHEHMTSIV
jgi:hypothetical protein